MYVCPATPVPVRAEVRAYEWSDGIATWGMFLAVLGILYLEYKTYTKPAASVWRTED
jgi:hypothetical protein